MDDNELIEALVKVAKPKCKGTKSSPVGSPRQRSFCKRMCGHKKKNTKSKKKKNPDSCINQALRRWKCRCAGTNDYARVVVSEMILDSFLGNKTAQQKMDQGSCKVLSKYTIYLRAVGLVHQQNHWAAKDYGHHLLLQRLYEKNQELADDAAERTIGLCGELLYKGRESFIAKKFLPKDDTLLSILKASLMAEEVFQSIANDTYDTLKSTNHMTLGLDDLIMSQASESESHIYLLKQAIKGLQER